MTAAEASQSTTGGASAGTGGADGLPALCSLPLDGGPCDGYAEVYGYDPAQGVCVPFVYGLCAGNENRFDTLEACESACHVESDACTKSADCTVRPKQCCACGLEQFEAVNVATTPNELDCSEVDCAECTDGSVYFMATCEAGRCVAFDSRTTELKKCATFADCKLRNGLGCCEACDGSHWVAVNKNADFSALCEGVGCDACVPNDPTDLVAQCTVGVCTVGWLLK